MFFVIFAVFGGFHLVLSRCPDQELGLNLWSDASLWGGKLPGPGDMAVVDSSVLLDVTYVSVTHIHVVGSGRLIFSDQIGEITIDAEGILVKDSASLIIGSETCRFQNKVNINLSVSGTRTTDRSLLDGKGEKFIALEGQASLQIYGQDKLGWTRLTETVERWPTTGDNIIYSHAESQFHFNTDRYNEGLAMYIFYECNEQPKYYRVFDFDQGSNTENEQRQVDQMIEALNGVEENETVAIATQRRLTTTANLTNLFSALETVSGIPRIALRDTQYLDPYALVFQKGGEANEDLGTMIGTDVQTAMASIVVDEKKVTAVSFINAKDNWRSLIDFRILSESVGFPTLTVVDDISLWQAGDEVIVATTDFSIHHTEVRKIKEIVDAHTLRLSDELDYRHFGKVEDGVDMRAEVGLLTRNIKIQGVLERECPPNNENCEQFEHDTYGAHTKIFGFTSVHIEGVEFYRVGQATDHGFYPVHFHMCQDISGKEAVIKSNSFHNSFARATTIHGTWGQNETHTGVQVLGNVAYNVLGHCYFTEDGAEKYTVIDGNLGALIKKIDNGFVTDKDGPTIFWITNPLVKLTNNAGAGSEGLGIWYVFPEAPVGPSEGMAYLPGEARRTPIWKFDNNVVHSINKDGFRFDDVLVSRMGEVQGSLDYQPKINSSDDESELVKTQISRLTSYKNRRNCWLRAGWFELMQYSSAESRRGLQSAKRNKYHTFVKKSVFVGRSRENFEDDDYPDAENVGHYFGIIQYDGPIYIDQVWFNGFQNTDKYIGGAIGFQPHKKFGEAFSSNTTDIRFGFVDKADGTGGNRIFDGRTLSHQDGTFFINDPTDPSASFRNGDNSILQCPGEANDRRHALMPESYIATDSCEIRNNWQMISCEHEYGMLHIGADGNGVSNEMTQAKRMNRLDAADVAYEDHSVRPRNFFTTVLGSNQYYYQIQFIEGFPVKTTFVGLGMDLNGPVVVGLCLPEGLNPDVVRLWGSRPPDVVTPNDGWILVDTLDEVFSDATMTRAYVDGRTVYVRLVSSLERNLQWDKLDNTHCPRGKCPFLSIELDTIDFVYTPCFTVPPEEQNKTLTDSDMNSMTCDLPASAPEDDWGAGDASREVIQGEWGEWSSWSECCGDMQTTRRRFCDNPAPKGGADCPGNSAETMDCPIACPVDGVLSVWGRWSECFCDGIATGSTGAATRTRECNVENDGQFCWGTLTESKPCYGGCQ